MLTKTALITGASSGIGRAIALNLAQNYHLVLLARRKELLDELQQQIKTVSPDCVVDILAVDINQHQQVAEQLISIDKNIDVLVNNAGLALGTKTANQCNWQDWHTMIHTNCMALAFLTHHILPSMQANNDGHIINMGSIAGDYAYKGGNVYGATKAFVDQLSLNLRADLAGSQVRVTNVMPGMLENTEFSLVRYHQDVNAAKKVYQNYQPLQPEDIANTVAWVLMQPKHVNINRIEVMPTCQSPGGLALSETNLDLNE